VITTDRMTLRQWQQGDLAPFAEMNADPDVMEFFERPLTREETGKSFKHFSVGIEKNGFGLWAVELRQDGSFIGMIGLEPVGTELPFGPTVEISWRLRQNVWGQGLAPEGASAALAYGFYECGLTDVVSMTALVNKPSWRVMEKIGMTRDMDGTFDHPKVSDGHAVKQHCLYRISASEFKAL